MKRLLLLLCLLPAAAPAAWGQALAAPGNQLRDSLLRQLAWQPADTSRVLLLGQLAHVLANENAAQSLRYGQQGLALARQLRYGPGEVQLLNRLGATYFLQKDGASAARYFQQAVRRAAQVDPTGRPLLMALLGLGRLAAVQQDYAEAQRLFQQALRQQQQLGRARSPDVVKIYNSLGILYLNWLNSNHPHPDSIGRLCLYYNRLSLNSLRTNPRTADYALYLNNVGLAHWTNKHYDSAEYYHRSALRVFERLGQPYDVAASNLLLSQDLLGQRRQPEAVARLRQSLRTARQLHAWPLVVDCSQTLAAALAAAGRGSEAYQLATQGQALNDSLQQAAQTADLTRLRVQFDTEQARSRVRELTQRSHLQQLQANRQRQYLWWLGSFLLAVAAGLLVAGLLARRLMRQRTELEATRAEQDRLYALIAHDLRSPVMAFEGLADLLTTYVARQDTGRLLGLGGRVRQAAEGLRELLDNLLHWALSQRGELQPVLEAVPVAELLAEVERLYQPSAEAAAVRLLVAPTAAHVRADRNMTLTILRNLVGNALKATPAEGRITVRALAAPAGPVQLEVADTGPGISAEEVQRARGGPARPAAGRYRGRAGLGLRLSFLFARIQAGQLDLRGTPGQGTVAVLTLPRAAA